MCRHFWRRTGLHQIQGIGDGFIRAVLDTSLIDEVVTVTDDDAMNTTRELAKVQGLLCGTSSGANIWACKKWPRNTEKTKSSPPFCRTEWSGISARGFCRKSFGDILQEMQAVFCKKTFAKLQY